MLHDEIGQMIKSNQGASIHKIEVIPLKNASEYNYCGAIADQRGHIIGIPNKNNSILDINPEDGTIIQWGQIKVPNRKGWTGGVLGPDEFVYALPRGANHYLKIDTINRKIDYISLNKEYELEHHYGGAMTREGIIIQPPKGNNNFLKFDTKTNTCQDVALKTILQKNFIYYGAVADLHNNIYFFPSGKWSRVAMVSSDGSLRLVGRILYRAFFNSGTLTQDGNILSFSSYGNGILWIDTHKKKVTVLEKNFSGGCFGAKLAFNGKIYSIPGNADEVYEFDSNIGKITNKFALPPVQDGVKAKCAGGVVDRHGNIWCIPAMGRYIYKLCFAGINQLPSKELYQSAFFSSTY